MHFRTQVTWLALLAGTLLVVGCESERNREDASPFDRAVRALETGTTPQRAAAAETLGRLGEDRAVGPLVAALNDPDASVRKAAVVSLQRLGARRVAPAIAALLEHPDDSLRVAAAEAMETLATPQTIPPLVGALDDRRMIVRNAVSEALARLGSSAVEPVKKVLAEGGEDARIAAARTLGKLGDTDAADALTGALEAESVELRLAAAGALADLGDNRAVPALLELMENPLSEEQIASYRRRMDRTPTGPRREVLIERLMRRHSGGLPTIVRYPHQAKKRSRALNAEAQHIRKLTETPLSDTARRELETVLAARTGWDDWDSLPEARKRKKIRAEAARLAAAVADDRESWGGSAVERYYRERHGAQWWASLSEEKKARELQRAAARPIEREMDSRRRQVRSRAARALARVGTPRAVETLLGILEGRNRDRRKLVRSEVRMAGNAAAKALAGYAALGDRPTEKRIAALDLLRTIHGASAPETLAELRDAGSARIRRLAGLALTEDPTRDALPWVLTLLNADSDDVRVAAARRLGEDKYAPAVAGLCDALTDPDPTVRFFAADALGTIGDPKAVEPLLKAARKAVGNRTPVKATLAAVRALGAIGDSDALPLILELTDHPSPDARPIALGALGGFDDPRALEAALAGLARKRDEEQRAAIWALKNIGSPAVGPLTQLLKDDRSNVRASAALALGLVGDAEAIPALEEAAGDDDTKVAGAARAALRKIR